MQVVSKRNLNLTITLDSTNHSTISHVDNELWIILLFSQTLLVLLLPQVLPPLAAICLVSRRLGLQGSCYLFVPKQGQCQAHWGPHSWWRLECKFYICVNPKWTYFAELMSFSKESQRFCNMFPQTKILHCYSIFRVLHINILANKLKIPECTFSAQRYNLHLNNKNYRNIQKCKSFISLQSECWATIIPRKMWYHKNYQSHPFY